MERAIQDLGAGVKFLRDAGYEKVVLIGNSGGAALASFYQAQAEQLTAHQFPDGDPTHLHADDLPPVDGIALARRAPGPLEAAARLDRPLGNRRARSAVGRPGVGHVRPAACGAATARRSWRAFSAAQKARRDRIEHWALERLAAAARHAGRAARPGLHRLPHACRSALRRPVARRQRPRSPGSVWGDARQVNYSANAMGRTTSLTAFLSQWSSRSQADGPSNLARTSVPYAAADLHRRPVDLSEHARRLAEGGRRAHPQRRHRRRQPLPGGPAAAGAASRRCDRRLGATRCERGRPKRFRFAPRLRAAALALRSRRPNWQRRHRAPSDRDRRRRPGRPHAGLRPRAPRRARGAARRRRHGRRARRLVARHLLRAEEPGDLRAPRHLRAHRRQGHHLVLRPHLLRHDRRSTTSTWRRRTASRRSRPSSTCSSSTSSGSWSTASSNWA